MSTVLRLTDYVSTARDKKIAEAVDDFLLGRDFKGFAYTIQERFKVFEAFRDFLGETQPLNLIFCHWMVFLTTKREGR